MISAIYESNSFPTYQQNRLLATAQYLEACNMLFERGILSHDSIHSSHRDVLNNMKIGFKYFTEWHEEMIAAGRYTVYTCTI